MSDIQLSFNYAALDTSTATTLQEYAGEIKVFMTKTLDNIIEVGKRLKDAQELLRYSENGGFRAWLKAEFDWSRPTAYNFMNVYDKFGECLTVRHLENVPLKALYALAAPGTPESVRQEVIDRAEAGEPITYSR